MEEGNVRGDISRSRNSGSGDIGYGFVDLERPGLEQVKDGLRNGAQWYQRTGRAQKERGPGFVGTQ